MLYWLYCLVPEIELSVGKLEQGGSAALEWPVWLQLGSSPTQLTVITQTQFDTIIVLFIAVKKMLCQKF